MKDGKKDRINDRLYDGRRRGEGGKEKGWKDEKKYKRMEEKKKDRSNSRRADGRTERERKGWTEGLFIH
jgi:hypothetical protein